MNKMFDIANHVRYVVALTRTAVDGKCHTPMKISIEVAEANDEEIVRDKLTRAFRREMYHEPNRELLSEQAVTLTWRWLEGLRSGVLTRDKREGNLLLMVEGSFSSFKGDHLVVRIFTKEDEERVHELFSRL